MRIRVPHNGQEIEVELDLAAHQLIPASRITEETNKRQAAEKSLADAQKQAADSTSAHRLLAARLAMAGDGVPDDRAAKRMLAAHAADVEGMEKPTSFSEWAKGDGASLVASLRAAPPAPAAAPGSPPAPAPAAPPSTNAGTVPGTPAVRMSPQQIQARQAELLAARKDAVARGDKATAGRLSQERQALYQENVPPTT